MVPDTGENPQRVPTYWSWIIVYNNYIEGYNRVIHRVPVVPARAENPQHVPSDWSWVMVYNNYIHSCTKVMVTILHTVPVVPDRAENPQHVPSDCQIAGLVVYSSQWVVFNSCSCRNVSDNFLPVELGDLEMISVHQSGLGTKSELS